MVGVSTDRSGGADEIDPETLQQDLAQIKEAMGIQEQYPTAIRLWVLYATLGILASLGSQAVVTFGLPSWGHALSWGGLFGLGLLYELVAVEDYEVPNPETKPDLRIQAGAVVGFLLAVLVVTAPLRADLGAIESQATLFGLIIATVGAIYITHASSLRAYQIRSRDRYAFAVGGVWMLAYGAVMPRIDILQEWGYAVFGVLFALHGIVSYVVLSR